MWTKMGSLLQASPKTRQTTKLNKGQKHYACLLVEENDPKVNIWVWQKDINLFIWREN